MEHGRKGAMHPKMVTILCLICLEGMSFRPFPCVAIVRGLSQHVVFAGGAGFFVMVSVMKALDSRYCLHSVTDWLFSSSLKSQCFYALEC